MNPYKRSRRKTEILNTQSKANLTMLVITMFWGSSYLFMKMGLESIEEFNLIALRFGIAFLTAATFFHKRLIHIDFKTVKYGFLLGTILFATLFLVTTGIKFTSISNVGFLFALSVVFVPVLLAVFFKQKTEKKAVFGVVISITGIGLLTLHNGLQINLGDFLVILSALLYAFYIVLTDKLTKNVDSITFGILQLGFSAAWGLLFSLVFETPQFPDTKESWISILALSILCSAVAFIGQAVAQKYTTPTHTGLIFSLEPVFAAFFAFVVAGEILTAKGYVGATLVLIGVLTAQIDVKQLSIRKRDNKAINEFKS